MIIHLLLRLWQVDGGIRKRQTAEPLPDKGGPSNSWVPRLDLAKLAGAGEGGGGQGGVSGRARSRRQGLATTRRKCRLEGVGEGGGGGVDLFVDFALVQPPTIERSVCHGTAPFPPL